MSKLQRRLFVLSLAVVLLLGPLVLMGNCSGWNEGSMKVASCAVDFPLARSLAELLYGAVLLSAFLIGLPILAYLALCLVALLALRRSLRRSSTAASPAPWKDWPGGARIAFAASMSLAALVLLGLSLVIGAGIVGWRAWNNAFAAQCRTAGEEFRSAPEEPVNGVYFEGDVELPAFQLNGTEYQSVESDYGPRLDDMIGRGWLQFTESPEHDARTGVASGRIIRRAVQLPFDGRPGEGISSRYGVYARQFVSTSDTSRGIAGTELEVRDRRSGSAIATLRYFTRSATSTLCGPVRDGRFAVGDFLVRALKLTRRAPQLLQLT